MSGPYVENRRTYVEHMWNTNTENQSFTNTELSISHLWELISSVRPSSNEPKLRLLLVGPCSSKRGREFGLLRMGWDGKGGEEGKGGKGGTFVTEPPPGPVAS